MGIKEKEANIITQFEHFEDWMDKYNLIIELGKEMEGLKEEFKTENRLIKGCQSQIWLHAEYKNGKIFFTADSDAIITKGIASLLIQVLSEETPDDILNTELEFIDRIGLKNHLSPNRSNGLVSMLKQMKLYAMAFKAKEMSSKTT
jgi:cysteine desulfuration protein SufE